MKFINISITDFINQYKNEKIILFGVGGWCHAVEYSDIFSISNNVAYCIDNGGQTEINMWDRTIPVFPPEKVQEEKHCVIVITTHKYMTEMYAQLKSMKLGDDIECVIYSLMCLADDCRPTSEQLQFIINKRPQLIPKKIHTFWFSGEGKPEAYQKCLDTWHKKCPDYEIYEWNLDNYDWHVHPYIEAAINNKAWAAASDFARLDVIFRQGGIYMDADVEVLQSLNPLLGNKSFFSFFDPNIIDLYMFGSVPKNPLIEKLLHCYYDAEIPTDRPGFDKYYQPLFAMKPLADYGVRMNGKFQNIDDNIFLPRSFLNLQDVILFKQLPEEKYSFAIHHANGGWLKSGYNNEKELRNREFYNRLVENK